MIFLLEQMNSNLVESQISGVDGNPDFLTK